VRFAGIQRGCTVAAARVWLAELAHVEDPALVAAVVAAALGIRDQPGVPAAEALARALARQQLLLVLDNCEHVIGAAASLCAGLLVGADDVRVLATSREPLRVVAEAPYRLGPLALPRPDDVGDVAGCEAVALFADRARRADTRFALDDQTGPMVARLVRRLDGMPLAIELAAARVEALGVAQLLERLDDRFVLLTAGDRLATARQRSLAATVAWSYQLLDDQERRVFRALSVFPGPFTLDAAEAVAGPGAGPAVLHLVDCSLLSPPRAGPDGRSRYVLLETLRAYGARLLAEAGEQEAAAAALARYALRVAEEAAGGLQTTIGEAAAARRLDAEDATVRQVLTWATEHDAVAGLRLAVALAPWWSLRGRAVSQYPLLRDAAGRAAPGSEQWCAAQFWLGDMAFDSADLAGALGHFTAVIDAMRDRRPYRSVVYCLVGRSVALLNLGRISEAAQDAHLSLSLARELGYPAGEVSALAMLGFAAVDAGDLDGAVQLARQAGQIPGDIPGCSRSPSGPTCRHALECCGYLCAATGRHLEAVTAWAAADAFFRRQGFAGAPAEVRRQQEQLRKARQALGPDRARAAEERGAAMSRATAAEYALMLTAPDPPAAGALSPGALSARERELVTLVAQGCTDAQIAAQLFISIRTVRSHLDRIRDKTGCRRRADLTRLALSIGLL
jgi:predicted ATPase/DNA-binding CsgD family transcriptional regulator